jgi:hypothetical protein
MLRPKKARDRSSTSSESAPSPATDRPTHAMVDDHEFFADIERGQCVYVVVYAEGKPSELFFAGYSYD